MDSGDEDYTWLQYYREESLNKNGKPDIWMHDKLIASTYETVSMLQDPITH